jgi:hypothetical protein
MMRKNSSKARQRNFTVDTKSYKKPFEPEDINGVPKNVQVRFRDEYDDGETYQQEKMATQEDQEEPKNMPLMQTHAKKQAKDPKPVGKSGNLVPKNIADGSTALPSNSLTVPRRKSLLGVRPGTSILEDTGMLACVPEQDGEGGVGTTEKSMTDSRRQSKFSKLEDAKSLLRFEDSDGRRFSKQDAMSSL